MMKLKSIINPDLMSLIIKAKPSLKRKTALWYFTNEIKSKGVAALSSGIPNAIVPNDLKHDPAKRKFKRTEIWDLWNDMHPEAKRRYFNMAESDEVRWKEQKALWIAKIGSILANHGTDMDKLSAELRSLQPTSIEPLKEYQNNYTRMIQTESTKTLYKELLEKLEKINLKMSTDTLISNMPQDCRPLLSRPRRPPSPFVIFAIENSTILGKAKMEANLNIPFLKYAGMRWSELNPDEKLVYDKKYNDLLIEYHEEMRQFKERISKLGDNSLDKAFKERRAYRKSLRKKLRKFDIVPVNVRNSFNFFLKDNKGIPLLELTKIWRNLPEEQKLKYKALSEEDISRYYKQKVDYMEMKQSLDSLLNEETFQEQQ